MAKYKVGDRVRMIDGHYNKTIELCGKVVPIVAYDESNRMYKVMLDNDGHTDWWSEKYFEPLENTEPAKTEQFNAVTKPAHYADKKIEVIDYIQDTLTAEEFRGFCIGNIIKYVSRWRKKGGEQDLEKALFYLNRTTRQEADHDR